MDICITPRPLSGTYSAIPSKSDAHRLLICAALANRPTTLYLPATSADIEATVTCLQALGAGIAREGGRLTVTPIETVPENPLLDCGESGSTLRFLLPVAASLCPHVRFTGQGRLPQRPLGPLTAAMTAHGVNFSAHCLPFETQGLLESGTYALPGDISSQYITGLLLALPRLAGESRLELTSPLESAAYVDITRHALDRFGISVQTTATGWKMAGGQAFSSPGELAVDSDWSNAAFFLAAGILSSTGNIDVLKLDPRSPQGDKAILPLLRQFHGRIRNCSGGFFRTHPSHLYPKTVDMSEIPDLLPILAVVAAAAKGKSHFTGAARLRLKESDRLKTTAALLRALGGKAVEQPAGLIVHGGRPLSGGTVDGAGDHRIVMAAAICAIFCRGPVTILGAEAVDKSYPGFWADYKQLGGEFHVL